MMPPASLCQILSGLYFRATAGSQCSFRLHSMASCRFLPALSSHTLTWDCRHSSTNLKEATLFHSFKPLLPLPMLFPTRVLAFWQTPVLHSPDVVISCEVFCSPSPPPSLVSALCSMMMLTTLAGNSFLSCSVSQTVGLFRDREEPWVVSEPQACPVVSCIRSSGKLYREHNRRLAAL